MKFLIDFTGLRILKKTPLYIYILNVYILWKEAPLIFSRNLDWSRDWKLLTSKKSIIKKWGGILSGTAFLLFVLVLSQEYSRKT